MITRYGGGNDGIAEYLESGRKAEREYTRDELDHRLILDGDLQTTNKVIHSIEDKGQERYLHITLSFKESEISDETLKAVTQEYKTLFMNAYHEDEYCFYAEAHLPKIKNLVDNRTGELIERKPHIHIVIPRTNLVTERSMNPRGDLTNSKTQEQLDAIQEHINNKYELISPKDGVRVSDENYANVLSRVKGDLYRERNNETKREIFSRITSENVKSADEFNNLLKNYGDVKIRNEGKPTEYYAVKFEGDVKFTNLKSPLFSRSFIESRQLPLVKPTPDQTERNLSTWLDKTSHEIKHIFPKSEKLRNVYKSMNASDKAAFLHTRINDYDRQYKLDKKSAEGARGRTSSNKFSPQSATRLDRIKTRIGLPHMPQRGLVRGISGRGKPPESVSILSHNEQYNLAERMETRQHSDEKMRRDSDRRLTERGIKTVELSSVLHESLYKKLNADAEKNEIHTMAGIRRDINPERFLSAASIKYNIKAEDHAVSHAKDGSPRFAVEKRNLNASDFLTKYLNLSWNDAKIFLLETYSQQLENKPFEKGKVMSKLTFEQSRNRLCSLKESNIFLREVIRIEKRNMYNELREMKKQFSSIPKENREVAKGVLVYIKLTTLESLNELSTQCRGVISQYHKDWNEDKDNMKALDKLKSYLNHEDENAISPAEKEFSLEKAVDAQWRLQEFRKNNSRLKDLVMDKREDKIIYRDQKTEAPVFTDKGDFIVSGKSPSNEEIGVMLEYSQEKFGGVLRLSGSDEFKKQCAKIAAEKDMNLILRPEQYQKLMLEAKNERAASREQTPAVEKEQAVRQAEVEQGVSDLQQSPAETKQAYKNDVMAVNEPTTYVYFVKFNNDQPDAAPTSFSRLKDAADMRDVNANLHDVNKQDAVIYRVDEKIADQKGLSAAMSDAVRVPRHEIEKAQGRDVTEQDGQILNVIDEYQQKFTSEGLIFDRGKAEGDLLQKEMTLDIASEMLEQKFLLEKERQSEQELDSGLEH